MKKTIMIVDDNRNNLLYASQLLKDEYNLVLAISGKKALESLEKNDKKTDLILLDIQMPEMDGFEFMEIIRNNEKYEHVPVIFLTASNDVDTEVKCIEMGAADFLAKPFAPKIMLSRVKKTLELEDYRNSLEALVERQLEEITFIQNEIIMGMANLIESRDDSTGQHVKKTRDYVWLIANAMYKEHVYDEIDEDFINLLYKASPMHDIGKISVEDSILKKPGRFTPEEFEKMKIHSKEGARLIKQIIGKIEKPEYVDMAYDVAMYHHEKWDGSGYPMGLKGEEIPLSARIMAVADVFDALVSKRCYKEAMPVEKAFDIIAESSGSHFDPKVAEVFLSLKDDIIKIMED